MAEVPLELVADYLHRVAAPLTAMSDAELLSHYARKGDGDAFAQLLRRHGPMVLGVCRRALGPTPDADDAFQATFIALARQARRVKESVPGWLFRVAVRASRRALRRADRAVRSADRIDSADDFAALEWRDVRRLLDEELHRLPDRWRSPLVLCYLDGLTRDEAAKQLGWSLRTLHRRLDEGRQRLRARLVKRGLGPAVLAAAVLGANDLRCAVPPALVQSTADRTAHGAIVPATIRTLIPRIPSTGGLAMKAVLSAVVLVGVFAVMVGERQPSKAGPPPVSVPPFVLARAPATKEKPPEDALAKKVHEAQEKGIKYLKDLLEDRAGRRSSWEDATLGTLQKGGATCLAMLALLESGVKPDDEAIARVWKYVRALETENTYVVSLQTQVFCKANQKKDAERIKRNVEWLEKAAVWTGGQLDGWGYTAAAVNRADNSNTRYAVAALHAAHRVGFKVSKEKLWEGVRSLYVRTQSVDGGWGYIPTVSRSTHTMSASGLLCLTLATDVLDTEDKASEQARANGFSWLAGEFRLKNPTSTFYNLDVIAALGRASEKKDFGTKGKKIEWYRLGAEWLLKEQKDDGSWMTGDALDRYPVISTSFALRFLASRPD